MSKIYQEQGRRVFGIQIQGCQYRYYDLANPFIDTDLAGFSYIDKGNMVSIGDYSCEIDISGGIANYSTINVSLLYNKDRLVDGDPSIIFGRLPKSTAVWIGQVKQNIKRTDNTPSIIIDSEPKINGQSLSYPRLFYIGAETFYVDSITDLGTGEYQLNCSERIGLRQNHQVLLETTDVPIISSDIVGWRGRLVDIYCAYLDENNVVSDKKIIFKGMIESSPSFSDGICSLSILPITAILDNKISANSIVNRMARGGHYFDSNPRFFGVTDIAKKEGGNGEYYAGTWGILLSDQKQYKTNTEILTKINTLGSYGIPPFSLVPIGQGYILKVGYSVWVDEDQGSGTWHFTSVYFHKDNVMWGNLLRGQYNDLYLFNRNAFMVAYNDGSTIYTGASQMLTPESISLKFIYDGFDFVNAGQVEDTRDCSQLPDAPMNSDVRELVKVSASSSREAVQTYTVKGIPDGFYMTKEAHILFEFSMGLPSTYEVDKTYTIQAKKGDKFFYFKATHEEQTDYGYLVYLDTTDNKTMSLPSLTDYADDSERWEFRLALSIKKSNSIQAILQILQSGGGDYINGAYDVQGMGANLPQSYIDIDSMLNLGSLSVTDQWEFAVPVEDAKIKDIIEPILKIMGCALVMKRSANSEPKMTIISITDENPALTTDLTVSDNDFLLEPPPSFDTFEDIITQFSIKYNYHLKEPSTANFFNHNIINRLSGETAKEEYELRGLTDNIIGGINATEVYNYLLPAVARLFGLYGEPHRIWNFSLGSGKALELDCCSTIKVTSSRHLKDYSDDFGVSNKVGRVKKLRISLMNEGAEVECFHFGKKTPTWNVAGKVLTFGSNTVTINNAYYSSNDPSYFKAGDVVKIYYLLSYDTSPVASNTLTIQSVVGNVITFTTNHGIATTNSIVVPANYDYANIDHKVRAYIGDINNELGSSNESGYKYE